MDRRISPIHSVRWGVGSDPRRPSPKVGILELIAGERRRRIERAGPLSKFGRGSALRGRRPSNPR